MQDLQALHDYIFAWGLHCYSRFDELDFVSGSHVYQKYQQQIACFGFLSSVVKHYMVATCIKKIMHNMICVSGAQYDLCDWCVFKGDN